MVALHLQILSNCIPSSQKAPANMSGGTDTPTPEALTTYTSSASTSQQNFQPVVNQVTHSVLRPQTQAAMDTDNETIGNPTLQPVAMDRWPRQPFTAISAPIAPPSAGPYIHGQVFLSRSTHGVILLIITNTFEKYIERHSESTLPPPWRRPKHDYYNEEDDDLDYKEQSQSQAATCINGPHGTCPIPAPHGHDQNGIVSFASMDTVVDMLRRAKGNTMDSWKRNSTARDAAMATCPPFRPIGR